MNGLTFVDELFLQLRRPLGALLGGDEAVDALALDAVGRRNHRRLRHRLVLDQGRLNLPERADWSQPSHCDSVSWLAPCRVHTLVSGPINHYPRPL